MKKLILIFIVIATMGLCCKDEPPTKPNPTGTVKLLLDYAECKEIGLKLSFMDNDQPRGYALLRDGEQITSGTLDNTEILLVDTTVLPGRDYTYIAYRLIDSKTYDSSPPLPVHSLDTTSHNIQWFVDTLGAQGVIRDVWIFDKNNAIAVGEIYLLDLAGKPSYPPFNVAKWNGTQWLLHRYLYDSKMLYPGSGGADSGYIEAISIFAFNENDIWIASGTVQHIIGNTVVQYRAEGAGFCKKIWGTSSINLFFVGDNGTVIRFNGSTWSKMPSNTTVDLMDIYGLDKNNIWIAGANYNDGHSVILSFDGNNWNKIYDSDNVPVQDWYDYKSVWTNNNRILYLASSGLLRKLNRQKMIYTTINTGQTYVSYCVRGTSLSDIFVTGANSEIAHFNGSSLKIYQDVQIITKNDVWWLAIKSNKDFIVAGGGLWIGYNDAPIVTRGYR